MFGFNEYIETKIKELSAETDNFEKSYRHDDAVFVKIKINVYDICKTVFEAFKKVTEKDNLYDRYINKLDEFKTAWSLSMEKAKEFGDMKKVAEEEAKLFVLDDVKRKFLETRGE